MWVSLSFTFHIFRVIFSSFLYNIPTPGLRIHTEWAPRCGETSFNSRFSSQPTSPLPEETSPCTHARKHAMDSKSLRISMKFTDSETCETLETEAVLPEACVQFCPVETEWQNFKLRKPSESTPTQGNGGMGVYTCSVVSHSLWSPWLWPARLLCPWDSPGKNTGAGCHFLLLGNLLSPGMEPAPPATLALAGEFISTEPPGKPLAQGRAECKPPVTAPACCPFGIFHSPDTCREKIHVFFILVFSFSICYFFSVWNQQLSSDKIRRFHLVLDKATAGVKDKASGMWLRRVGSRKTGEDLAEDLLLAPRLPLRLLEPKSLELLRPEGTCGLGRPHCPYLWMDGSPWALARNCERRWEQDGIWKKWFNMNEPWKHC